MFRPKPSFTELLEKLFDEVGWKNPYQAAMAAGIHYSTLHNVMTWPEDRKGKRYALSHKDVSGLLLAARACGLSNRRYEYWYEVLHKHLIANNMASALLYSTHETSPRDQEYCEDHNQTIMESLKKQHAWFESAVDSAFRAGAETWGLVPIAALVEQCVRRGGPAIVYVQDDWVRFLNMLRETILPVLKYSAIPLLGALVKAIASLDDEVLEILQHIWKLLKGALKWTMRMLIR